MKCAASEASQPIGNPICDFFSDPFERSVRKSPKESRMSVKCCSKGASRIGCRAMGHSRNEIMVKKWELSSEMRDFQEDMTQKSPDTLERFIQVFGTLNGGLTDVTLLNERTPPDVRDHSISRQRFARRWREELCHGALQADRHRRAASETQAGARGASVAEEETRVDLRGRRGA